MYLMDSTIQRLNNCMGAWLGYWFNIKNPHPFPCKLLCCSFPFNRMNPISIICDRNETVKVQISMLENKSMGARVAKWWELVRALASHQCGPGSKPIIDATCGLSSGFVRFFEQKLQGLFKDFQGHISHFSRTPFSAKKSLESMSFLVLPQHEQFYPEGLSY